MAKLRMIGASTSRVTLVDDSRAMARARQDAQYIETEGLGHRGALQSKEIHEQVVKLFGG